jgi:HEAT repeat protein
MPLVRKPGDAACAPTPPGGGEESVRRTLFAATADERWAAARAAAELPALAGACGEALARERDARVREALFTSLVRMATAQSVDAVLPFLRADDAQLRAGATGALAAMRETAWPRVALLLHDADPHIRILACELARSMPEEEAVPCVCNLLDREREANVCAAAVETLAEVGGAQALPALERCAERFRDTPFLEFSIEIAADRIRAQQSAPSD